MTNAVSGSSSAANTPSNPSASIKRKRVPEASGSTNDGVAKDERAKRVRLDLNTRSTAALGATKTRKGTTSKSSGSRPAKGATNGSNGGEKGSKIIQKGKEPAERAGADSAQGASKGQDNTIESDDDMRLEGDDGSSLPSASSKQNHAVRKLDPPRPWPTVPTAVSATGPRSSHHEGKNYICITRKTKLGAYLRRCKDLVIKDGYVPRALLPSPRISDYFQCRYKTLHLSAMGAAIPQLVQLSVSLPSILPHAADEIKTEILTGTVEVQDELIPEDDDEDTTLRTRNKSVLQITLTIGDGDREVAASSHNKVRSERPRGKRGRGRRGKGGGKNEVGEEHHDKMEEEEDGEIQEHEEESSAMQTEVIVMQEPEQEDD
jgi:ribonuclease P/MRP protein subunit RPP20